MILRTEGTLGGRIDRGQRLIPKHWGKERALCLPASPLPWGTTVEGNGSAAQAPACRWPPVPHPLQKCTHSTSLNLQLPLPGLPAPISPFKAHSPSQIHCLGKLSDLPFHPVHSETIHDPLSLLRQNAAEWLRPGTGKPASGFKSWLIYEPQDLGQGYRYFSLPQFLSPARWGY